MIKQDIFSNTWCDIVFDGRNKEYGAYLLRKHDRTNTAIAILISTSVFLLGFSLPAIVKLLSPEEVVLTDHSIVWDPITINPPPLDKILPPPPIESPKPLKSIIKFTPPTPAPDEDVVESIPTPEELKDNNIGITTQEGDSLGTEINLGPPTVLGKVDDNEIFLVVEQNPEFPGGELELRKYMAQNIHFPKKEQEMGHNGGTVYISFVIEKDGKVANIEVVKGIAGGKNFESEALRVIKTLPDWKPGKQNGNPVRVKFVYPVKFVLR